MPKFSFEVPLAHLDHFTEEQDFYFTLSFLYSDNRYRKWVSKLDNTKLWIDNSANEKVLDDVDTLAGLFKDYNPAYLVVPDNADWGYDIMLRLADALTALDVPRDRLAMIIHHPDWVGYLKQNGITKFCVPYDFRYCSENKLKSFGQHHFLGLNSLEELAIANPPSCDTALPIKLALMDLTIDDWLKAGSPHFQTTPSWFDLKMSTKQISLARSNISQIRSYEPEILTRKEDYTPLRKVLKMAYDQATIGKGKIRHAQGKDFTDQTIMNATRRTDGFGAWFQVYKKVDETLQLPRGQARINEMLGVIIYSCAYILNEEEWMKEGGDDTGK